MGDLSPHFSRHEFRCRCGCGGAIVDPHLVEHLETLRRMKGNKPIRIVSGYRCASHNAAVGGSKRSQHLVGRAADLEHGLDVSSTMAARAGFTGIGTSKGRVTHADVRKPPRAHWTY